VLNIVAQRKATHFSSAAILIIKMAYSKFAFY